MSCVVCRVSSVACCMSHFTCHMSLTPTATATAPTPANTTTMHSTRGCIRKQARGLVRLIQLKKCQKYTFFLGGNFRPFPSQNWQIWDHSLSVTFPAYSSLFQPIPGSSLFFSIPVYFHSNPLHTWIASTFLEQGPLGWISLTGRERQGRIVISRPCPQFQGSLFGYFTSGLDPCFWTDFCSKSKWKTQLLLKT